MSDNITDIAIKLFSNDPQPPKTIDLKIYHDIGDNCDEFVAKMLVSILHEGMKYLYGTGNPIRVDLNKLQQKDVNKLKEYIASIGYKLYLDIYYQNDSMPDHNLTGIGEYPLTITTNSKKYTIRFDRL